MLRASGQDARRISTSRPPTTERPYGPVPVRDGDAAPRNPLAERSTQTTVRTLAEAVSNIPANVFEYCTVNFHLTVDNYYGNISPCSSLTLPFSHPNPARPGARKPA